MRVVAVFVCVFLLSGCATTPRSSNQGSETGAKEDLSNYPGDRKADAEFVEIVTKLETGLEDNQSDLPIELNQQVKKWIEYFTVRARDRFARYLNRGARYQAMVSEILAENDLPPELYYLAMIESGYHTHAHSHASAVGIWQFIRGTGKRYGLQVDSYVDERRDPIRATEAAARYLRDLHRVFDSWYLALAAYNAGENRVVRAVMQGKSRNFWDLVEKKRLPRETRNYVPKFLAAVIIGRSLEKYGFSIELDKAYPDVDLVSVPAPLRLRDIAKTSGVSLDTIKRLNPHIRRGITPPNARDYELWIPSAKVKAVKGAETKLAKLKLRGVRKVAQNSGSRSRATWHKVRRGESLERIARKYSVSVGYLQRLNKIQGTKILIGQRLRVRSKAYHPTVSKGIHRVRKGETLYSIARRYGVSVSTLKNRNRLRGSRIMVGQRLRVGAKLQQVAAAQPAKRSGPNVKHRVRRGDTLSAISLRYRIPIPVIRRANGLENSEIMVGQVLQIPRRNGGT